MPGRASSMWGVALAVSAALLCWTCSAMLQVYFSAPTITRLEQNNMPTYNVPFPAVTVCYPDRLKMDPLVAIVKECVSR